MRPGLVALLGSALVVIAVVSYTFAQSQTQGKAPSKALPAGKTPAATQSPAKANLVIRKALYGDLDDGLTIEVTDKVRAMVKDGTLNVAATDSNLGDPYKGREMKLTIIKAELRAQYLNFGGPGGSADITDTIKQFQEGNRLTAKMSGGSQKITVYYKYGEGKTLSVEQAEDGSIVITPPTKLRADYSFNGIDTCKIVNQGDKLEIYEKLELGRNDLKPFLGRWSAT
jgi:hypothetical protein